MNGFEEIERVAAKYDLSVEELRALLSETDEARRLLTPAEAEQGLANVVAIYVTCLGAAAERVVDPVERLFADRFVGMVVEMLTSQLAAATHSPN